VSTNQITNKIIKKLINNIFIDFAPMKWQHNKIPKTLPARPTKQDMEKEVADPVAINN
jgi:hypothetical protein